jgi:hypothetical protein
MCIICIEYQRTRDWGEAQKMLEAARREPNSIDSKHLDDVEKQLERVAKVKDETD